MSVDGKDGACVGSRDGLRLFLFFDKTSLRFPSNFVPTSTTNNLNFALELTGINVFWFNLSASCIVYTRHAFHPIATVNIRSVPALFAQYPTFPHDDTTHLLLLYFLVPLMSELVFSDASSMIYLDF